MGTIIRVTCAIILEKGRVLCAQRNKNMSLPLKWELPGGKIEPGESPEDCLIREVREELQVDISIRKPMKPNLHDYGAGVIIELIPFICRLNNGKLVLHEHKQIKWVTFGELIDLDWAAADIPIIQELISDSDNQILK